MDDSHGTKSRLIEELESLRARMRELERREDAGERPEPSPQDSEAGYRRIFENANDMIYTHDLEGRFTSANPATLRAFGYSLDEFLELSIADVVAPDYLSVALESLRKKLQGIRYTEPYELLTMAKDNSPIWVEVSSCLITEHGRPTSVQGILRDVTKRKRTEEELRRARDELEMRVQERTAELTAANRQLQREIAEHKWTEQALRESERRYRLLAENVTDIIWTTDLDLRFNYISPSTTRMRGYSVEEAVSQKLEDLLTPASHKVIMETFESLPPFEEMAESDPMPSWTFDLEMVCKDGSTVWAEARMTLLCDPQGHPVGFLGVTRDITQRRQAETEKAKIREQLHQVQKMQAVGQLAAGVSHDFTNLLAVILGHAGQAKKLLPDDHPAGTSLGLIEQVGDQAMDVAKSLLTFSQNMPTRKKPVDLRKLADESTQLLRHMLPSSIDPVVEVERDQPLWVIADTTQLQQVVLNLTINARDAMPDGGTLSVSISRATAEDTGGPTSDSADLTSDVADLTSDVADLTSDSDDGPGLARIEVSDTGVGMSDELRPRIFEPFFTTKQRGQGTGLGLSIVHGIVEDHGGRIEVSTEVGRGSTFAILLPCISDEEARRELEPAAEAPGGRGATVLLAEDHQLLREIMVSSLRSQGYEVVQARDGLEALARYRQHRDRIRLLVLDKELSQRSGVECLGQFRAEGSQTPAILIADEAGDDPTEGLAPGTVLLGKPFTMPELGSLVASVLKGTATAEDGQ